MPMDATQGQTIEDPNKKQLLLEKEKEKRRKRRLEAKKNQDQETKYLSKRAPEKI